MRFTDGLRFTPIGFSQRFRAQHPHTPLIARSDLFAAWKAASLLQ